MAAWRLQLPLWETPTLKREQKTITKILILADTYWSGRKTKRILQRILLTKAYGLQMKKGKMLCLRISRNLTKTSE
jgi:hypothetical protein